MSSGAAGPNRGIGRNADNSVVVWKNCPCKCLKLIGKAQLHCQGIGRNADDSAVLSVSALYGTMRVLLHMLERPVSGCRHSLLEPANLTLK